VNLNDAIVDTADSQGNASFIIKANLYITIYKLKLMRRHVFTFKRGYNLIETGKACQQL
jgi:hypothetical protein